MGQLAEALTRWTAAGAGAARLLLNAILPPQCLACSAVVEAPGQLCADCFKSFTFIAPPHCGICGLPLGQTWLLGGAILYLFGCIAWLLLFGRVARLREQALAEGGPASAPVQRSLKFGAAYGLVGLLLFLSVLALMLAKPL